MPVHEWPSLAELLPLVLIPLGAGLLKWLRVRWQELADEPAARESDGPGVVFVFARAAARRLLILRAVVIVSGSFGAGLTAGLALLGAGYPPALQWAAAAWCAVMGWDAFYLARDILLHKRGKSNAHL